MPRYNTEIHIEPYVSAKTVEDPELAKRILRHNKVEYASIVSLELEWITRSPDKQWYSVTYKPKPDSCDYITSLNKETAESMAEKVAIKTGQDPLPYRVIVAGGRDFNDPHLMDAKLDEILSSKSKTHKIIIVEGAARGADQHGERYAGLRGYDIEEYPANWDAEGKSAGYNRNKRMAKVADACVCFWDGQSRGTKHMIDIAKEAKLPLRIIKY